MTKPISGFKKPPMAAALLTAEDFINAPSTPATPAPAPAPAPAVAPGVAPVAPAVPAAKGKRTEIFNLRLTIDEAATLAKIAETTPYSRQAFVLSVLIPALEAFEKSLKK